MVNQLESPVLGDARCGSSRERRVGRLGLRVGAGARAGVSEHSKRGGAANGSYAGTMSDDKAEDRTRPSQMQTAVTLLEQSATKLSGALDGESHFPRTPIKLYVTTAWEGPARDDASCWFPCRKQQAM